MNGSESKGASKSQPSESNGSGNTGGGNRAKPARLCYVDDSRTSAYVVKRMLKPYGYEVDHFFSAEPALIALIESDYDLLLTDLKVSPTGMDGDDLVRTLRSSGHSKTKTLPIIVITGSTDSEVLSQVYKAGANQIMTKPVIGEELDANIRQLVGKTNQLSSVEDEFAEIAAKAAEQSKLDDKTSATVVPFGIDAKKAGLVDSTTGSDAGISADKSVHSNQIHNRGSSTLKTPDGRVIPRPSEGVKPAPQVKPILRELLQSETGSAENTVSRKSSVPVKPDVSTRSSTDKLPQARQQPNPQKLAPAAKTTQPQTDIAAPHVTGQNQQLSQSRPQTPVINSTANVPGTTTRPVDPDMAKKAKAIAAAKRAKLIEQQRARLAAQAKVREKLREQILAQQVGTQTKKKNVQEILEPEIPLTLEPLAGESLSLLNRDSSSTFNRDTPTSQPDLDSLEFNTPASHQVTPQVKPNIPSKPISTPSTKVANDVFAEAARSVPEDSRAVAARLNSGDVFGGQGGPADILQQMDAYSSTQTSTRVGSSGILSSVSSILELWGPKKLILAILVVSIVAFFYNRWSSFFSDAVSVEVTPVEQGEIFQSINVPGKVVSKLRVDITPAIAGRLTNVYVEEGSLVKKGELMARLDDREAVSYLKRTEVNMRNAEEDVTLAERNLKRIRKAFSKGAVARRMVEEAQVELRSARARKTVAEDEVKSAKHGLENPRIVAPFSGIVTGRFAEVGQWVVPSETLFSLVDQKQREVEVRVDAADSGGIAVGQTVTLSSDAFPTLEWPESVTRLAAATSNVGNANTVSVYISLGNRAPALRFGQQVDAEIRTAWNPSALKVPYDAIINRGGKSYVAMVHDNIVKLVPVETGIEDLSHIEIRQGVTVGQEVVLANGKDLSNGDKVIVSSSK